MDSFSLFLSLIHTQVYVITPRSRVWTYQAPQKFASCQTGLCLFFPLIFLVLSPSQCKSLYEVLIHYDILFVFIQRGRKSCDIASIFSKNLQPHFDKGGLCMAECLFLCLGLMLYDKMWGKNTKSVLPMQNFSKKKVCVALNLLTQYPHSRFWGHILVLPLDISSEHSQ